MGAVLTRQAKKNILVDADLSNPCLSLHLGLSHSQLGLQDVLQHKKRFGDAVLIQPQTGMRVLPASMKYVRGASLKHLGKVLNDVSKAYEFTIIDSPPGITDDVLHIINACSEVVVITTPDVPGVSAATKMISLCKKNNKRVLGVVVNRSTGANYELTNREVESMTETAVLARIPEDKAIPASISVRTPAVYYSPNAPSSKKLHEFSLSLIAPPTAAVPSPSIFSRVASFFRRLFRLG